MMVLTGRIGNAGGFFVVSLLSVVLMQGGCQPGGAPGEANRPPVANAGAHQDVLVGETVVLDGSGSSDPDNDTLGFTWTQIGGTAVVLSDPNAAMPTFIAPDVLETLTFQLVVIDGRGGDATASVTVTVIGNSPKDPGGPTPTLVPVPTPAVTDPSKIIYVDSQIQLKYTSTYDPATRDERGGTARAYRVLDAAAQAARPGDTVLLREGTFGERLKPGYSGTEGQYITFRNYENETPVISGAALMPAIDVSGRSYIIIQGLTISDVSRWMYAVKVHHIILRDNRFVKATDGYGSSKTGIFFQEATYCQILNNTIEDSTQDNLVLIKSDRNRVEGNTIRQAAHTLWAIKGGNFNVLRSNFFENASQRIGEVYDMENVGLNHEFTQQDCTQRNLIERNMFAGTPYSSNPYEYNAIQYAGQKGIIRHNVFCDNRGGGLGMHLYRQEALYNYDNRVYQNVFCRNHHGGILISDSAQGHLTGNIFINNILCRNDGETGPVQVRVDGLSGYLLTANSLFGQQAGDMVIDCRGPQSLAAFEAANPTLCVGGLEVDPMFVDEANRDFHLQAASPLIDKGAFLTQAVGTGSGVTLVVKDASYFFDGFGVPNVSGDVIQLAGQTETATVVKVDYANNTLTLDRSLSWSDGQGVALQYAGSAPDPGAYEHGLLSP